MPDVPKFEQLRIITPEYDRALQELDSLVVSFPGRFPDDIEYFRNGYRLPLRSEGMAPNTHYVVSKSLPFPHPEEPDWDAIPAQLGWVDDCGTKTHGYARKFIMREGVLTSGLSEYDNNEFLDEDWPQQELSEADIRRIIDELSAAGPVHPDAIEQGKTGKIARVGSFIKRVLFRK